MVQAPDEETLLLTGKQAVEDVLRHATVYDPQKAREYYLRTRHLKGRRPAASQATNSRAEFEKHATGNEGKYARPKSNAEMRASRRRQLEAEKAKLERRIEELKNALESLVRQAKRRAGISASEDAQKDSDPKEQADRNTRDKKDKPLTEKQKADKRKASKEQYEKEKGMTLSREVEALRDQAIDIRAKLEAAIADAQKHQSKPRAQFQSTTQTASNSR